ncbi:transient receptor potential cation channel subfamily M member-like 2 isoform X2 [Physella acuta]|uniref:transient receptor potential cation channel subfamily M member-like 2 isoform X2 n=1 Tax=Physella acuta TaxID=109671 RepID=UPI0027DD2197|nr:transient receptor potential cation channel subfamily M member-like 2 isoform X2 [Physella acuta]
MESWPLLTKQVDIQAAERKALMALIYWAVLNNRHALCKVLWQQSSEPIAVALVISNMFYRLHKLWITDVRLSKAVKDSAVHFGTLAIHVMDLTYSDSALLGFHALVNPLDDFNHMNVVDLALIGNNIFFIAHPCCQRSMRERWLGNIIVKSFGRFPISIPEFMKILLCLFFVFPMYFWLNFDTRTRHVNKLKTLETPASTKAESNLNQSADIEDEIYNQDGSRPSSPVYEEDPFATPNIFWQIYFLWTAPISKFWLNQLFMLIYLALFAYAMMIPYCGDEKINITLMLWTTVNLTEHIIGIVKIKLKFPTYDLFWPLMDITVELLICCVTLHQILQVHDLLPDRVYKTNFVAYKFHMALGMLFMYFRALRYLLPVSQELGPMLVNITNLTRTDVPVWFTLWAFLLFSMSLAIQFINYPALPLTWPLLGKALLRGILGLFLTEISDLDDDPVCHKLHRISEIAYTCDAFLQKRVAHCPYQTGLGYVMVILHLLITRMVYFTLMFAIFGVTINKTTVRSVEIWKYQFYSMVTDFESRSVVPAPLIAITYPFRVMIYFGKLALTNLFRCNFCFQDQFKRQESEFYSVPYNRWKSYMSIMAKREEEKETNILETLSQLEEDSAAQKVMMRRLNDRLVDIEKSQMLIGFALESLLNSLHNLDPKAQVQKAQAQTRPIHVESRKSPYPGTDINRFPVLEKEILWEVTLETYDPPEYTKPVEEFPLDLQPWVDPDILNLNAEGLSIHLVGLEDENLPHVIHQFEPNYNAVTTITLPSGHTGVIDRTTYMTSNAEPLQYELDATSVPRNPMGRTGLRGRGKLYFWGPNHMMQAVISRWKAQPSGQQVASKAQDPPSSKRIEILVVQPPDTRTVSLPAEFVIGGISPHGTMCTLLKNYLSKDSDAEDVANYDQEEMVQFYSQFASAEMQKKNKSMYAYYGYSAMMVYRGYQDDPSNTDNAWQETEIWNFHYKYKDCFDSKIKEGERIFWLPVTENMQLSPIEFSAVLESAKLHNADV